ncbi:ATP-binding protein [Enterococcus faecalis]
MQSKEELNYIVEDRVLAEVLGRQNFSNKESAVLELVKNAYDAGADNLSIIFQNTKNGVKLTIIDDGTGMNEADIKNAWMHVGKSTRGYYDEKTNRIYAGSKGIGRFALSRLGEEVEMITKKVDDVSVVWSTNWERSFLINNEKNTSKGTKFVIKRLRDRWNRRSVQPLKNYLSKIYNDTRMNIEIEFESEKGTVKRIWDSPIIGENYVTSLTISYDSENYLLKCKIESDEFNDVVFDITKSPFVKEYNKQLNMYDALAKSIEKLIEEDKKVNDETNYVEEQSITENEIKQILRELGNFSGQFYFSLNSVTKGDYEWFEYKHKVLLSRYKTGVILYRNAFGIDSFEGRNDWLGFSKRSSNSPAAATHPTGNWRVRANQISGYVEIDKEKNRCIEDLSNRQGIVENIHFEVFKKIILEGISELEYFRQTIIRSINEHKKANLEKDAEETEETEEAVKILNELRSNFKSAKNLTEEDIDKVITEFDRRENEKKISKEKKRK